MSERHEVTLRLQVQVAGGLLQGNKLVKRKGFAIGLAARRLCASARRRLAFGFGNLAPCIVLTLHLYILWVFIVAQPEKDWLAHDPITRPLGKLDLAHQFWFDPLHRLVGFRRGVEWGAAGLQR